MVTKAKESRQVITARKKLEKRLEVEHQKFTSDALAQMTIKIRALTERHHLKPKKLAAERFSFLGNPTKQFEPKNKHILKLIQSLQNGLESSK